jgi:hypothetical protein
VPSPEISEASRQEGYHQANIAAPADPGQARPGDQLKYLSDRKPGHSRDEYTKAR